MTVAAVPRFGGREMARFLIAPDAREQLSPVSGPGAVVIDLAATKRDEANSWSQVLVEELPTLPCVTLAILDDETDEATREAADSCDVVVRDEGDLEAILPRIASTPLAALAFVQLLRSQPTASPHAGLVAESFVYSMLQSGAEFRDWLASRPRKTRKTKVDENPACRLEREGGRLEITLSHASRHNAFSRAMRDALCEALELALADASIERVTLQGDGPSFCSGGDLAEFGSFAHPANAHAVRTTRSPAFLLSRLAGRAVARVHGACIGAGIELPAFCDRVIASEDAFFQLPELSFGLVPGAGGTVSLPRRIGRQRTAWLGLSGHRIDAQTALSWGLVDEIRLGHPVETGTRSQSN